MRSLLAGLARDRRAQAAGGIVVALVAGVGVGGLVFGGSSSDDPPVVPVTVTPTSTPTVTSDTTPWTEPEVPEDSVDPPDTETTIPEDVEEDMLSVEYLLDEPVDSALVAEAMRTYGCRAWVDLAIPSGLAPGSGTDCKEGGIGFAVDTALRISDVRMYGPYDESFNAFTGPLPLGLAWGMDLGEVVDGLTALYGEPVNVFEPSGEWTNYFQLDFAVDDQVFQGLQLEFTADTEALQGLTISRVPPMEW